MNILSYIACGGPESYLLNQSPLLVSPTGYSLIFYSHIFPIIKQFNLVSVSLSSFCTRQNNNTSYASYTVQCIYTDALV